MNSLYGDRNSLNASQPEAENNSLSAPPQPWPAPLNPSSEHYPEEQSSVPFYNPATNTSYYCAQPAQPQTEAWPSWPNESNNNNPSIFQPQNQPLNPQADPWQWSVDQSAESTNWGSSQGLPPIPLEQSQPSYEQYPTQQIPEMGYYYGQPSTEQWDYSKQQLGYESTDTNASWNSWNQPNEPVWNPVSPDDQNHSIKGEPNATLPIVSQQVPDIEPIVSQSVEPVFENHTITRVTDVVEESLSQEYSIPPDSTTNALPYAVESQADEPNQEVPEPVKSELQSMSPVHNSSIKLEKLETSSPPLPKDPPNEQIPFKPDSPISGMAVSAEVPSKNVVIKPWDGGPFQPPANRLPNSEVVQREIPETVDSVTSSLSKLEINTEPEISANMESEPDNLEQPPDPSVNRVNPHHVALHKEHFAEELDSEASKTNLWEQPNLPNVLFLPATLSDNLSRSGSPALNPAPPTIPVSIPFNESVISNASPPHLADNSKTMGRNDNPLNLVELDKSPVRRRPETFDRADSKSSISKSNTERVQSTEKILPQSSAPVAEMETRNSQDRRSRDSQDKDIDDRDKNLKSYRYREMEDIDSHYDNRNQYNNDRYYYNDRRERVSRPSSRASEPAGNHYSSRYNHSRDFDPNGALLPAREGTPSRIIMSEDDLRRDRHSNEYRDLRGSKSDLRDFRDSRDMIDSLNSRDPSYHKSRDPRDIRDPRGQDYGEDGRNRGKEDYPDSRGYEDDLRRDRRSNEYRNLRGSKSDLRDVRDPRDRRDPLDSREPRDPRDRRDPLDSREPRDPRDRRDPFDSREPRDPRDRRDPLDSRELRDPSYSRDHRSRDPRDIREPRGQDYAEDGRNRGREDYTDTRGYKEDRRQQHTRGGEEDYYNRNRGYNKNGNYGYDYYRQPDPYSMYYNYYNYPMNYNYGYYDELYRSNPKYREQVDNYRAYYSQMGYDSDRMSSHSRSGRSSVNDEISKDSSRFQKDYDTGSEYSGYQPSLTLDNSYNQPDSRDDSVASHITPARLTPAKFSCPHIISKLTPGKLLTSTINNTSLQIHDMQQILSFDNTIENFKLYPGPLLNEQTHKNDVIQFCQLKITTFQCNIEIPDRDSQVLLWELLVLMLRQNGNVSGSDVAELLLKDRHVTKTTNPSLMRQASAAGSSSSPSEDALELPTLLTTSSDGHLIVNDSATPSPDEGIVVSQDSRVNGGTNNSTINSSRKEILSTDQITEKFTEYLLCGHKKDALEWASKHGLWGHALFLASKMDSRSYAYIMTRFANSLPLNDPLQTLYQLMSGRQPYAVTRLVDEKFGDWRVHLAMILSNLSSNIEVDCRSMTTLGDTLAQRGCLSAAHFCYLMSQINFGRYEQKSSKLVLLTSSHTLPFAEFASNEAIQCTEIYEYARSLASPGFVLPHLQPYKLLYASRLAEYGLLQESLHYCEVMTSMAKNSRSSFSTSLLLGMSEIVWKLKYHDPHYTQAQGELEDIADPEWITQLFSMAKDTICNPVENNSYIEETYTQDTTLAPSHSNETEGSWVNNSEPTGQPQPQLFNPQPVNTDWSMNQNAYNQPSFMGSYGQPEPQESMANASQNATDETNSNSQLLGSNTYNSDSPTLTSTTKSSFDYYGSATTQFQPPLQGRERQDSVGSLGYARRDSSFSNTSVNSAVNSANSNSSPTSKPSISKDNSSSNAMKKEMKGKPQSGGSWFGKLFGNFLPKGPNQMILPDDKNPSIVWDAKNSKWMNTYDDDSNSTEAAPMAPPKDSELKPPSFASPPSFNNIGSSPVGPPSIPSTGINRFQRPKFKNMRQNYVDVLNVNNSNSAAGATQFQNSAALPPNDPMFQKIDQPTQIPNFFIPAPAPNNDAPGDFVTQGHIPVPSEGVSDSTTPMFDPAEFSTAPKVAGDLGQKRSIGGYNLASRRAYPS